MADDADSACSEEWLHPPWREQAQWRVLDSRFGHGLNFLEAWRRWRDDPQRPQLLHFVSFEPSPSEPDELRRTAAEHAVMAELAAHLCAQWWGLVPGTHRLSFESGRVLLTLGIGEPRDLLPRLDMVADSVFLSGADGPWERTGIKALARCCRRGTRLMAKKLSPAVARELQNVGFVINSPTDVPTIEGSFEPAWITRLAPGPQPLSPDRALVIGAGLAGAAAAASLVRRGWKVHVLDAAAEPAGGASALPAGLLAPHSTPDDNLLSRLTRCGIRITLQQAAALLEPDRDWQPSGVLELRRGDDRALPSLGSGQETWQQWRNQAEGELWHAAGGWIKPAALVRAWLGLPNVHFRGSVRVHQLLCEADRWTALDASGHPIEQARLVVVAAAHDSATLLEGQLALNPVRGQVSWDWVKPEVNLPATPVNGNGHFLPRVPVHDRVAWLSGSSYVRGDTALQERPGEHQANFERLQSLLPDTAQTLAPSFKTGAVQAWSGVRCTASDRRPLVGELAPGLWVSTAMGSRGLTFAALCGELLAARLHAEPLPLDRRLAQALAAERQRR